MKAFRKWLKITSLFTAHAVLLGIPWIAIWGACFPWPPAEQVFSEASESSRFFVGMKVSYTRLNGGFIRTEARNYVLLPFPSGWPRLVTVSRTDQDPPQRSDPSVVKFLALLGTYLFAALVVWRTWFGRRLRPVPIPESVAPASHWGEVH